MMIKGVEVKVDYVKNPEMGARIMAATGVEEVLSTSGGGKYVWTEDAVGREHERERSRSGFWTVVLS
jgi:hypothetical protein